jgi:hypothetical protein
MKIQMKNMAKTAGYIILSVSVLLWLAIAVIPFLGYTKAQTAGIITGLIIAGEITFYLGIFLLGKTIYNALKSRLMFWKKKSEQPLPPEGGSSPI